MAALVEALDTPTQYGENNHSEYGWSDDIQELILQLSFQFTRCDESQQQSLSVKLDYALRKLDSSWKTGIITFGKYQELMITAYKMIGHTRDIIDGKGEYSLAYMQILVWYNMYPELAMYALKSFVQLEHANGMVHPYGSWKDIKYFCNYCKNSGLSTEHPLIQYALTLVNNHLKEALLSTDKKTLLAKWIPREKSNKFGWIFDKLAEMYFRHYMDSAKTPEQKKSALLKAKMSYRQIISKLNIELDTVQIKQCGNAWSKINHSSTTSITLMKQKQAFLNIMPNRSKKSEKLDRIQCAANFKHYLEDAIKNNSNIKGKRVGLNQFTKEALKLIKAKNKILKTGLQEEEEEQEQEEQEEEEEEEQESRPELKPESKEERESKLESLKLEIDLINSQWRDNSTQTKTLGPMIPMVDLSGSMLQNDNGIPYYSAIAIGCRIAEKSILGKRILTFSTEPSWHNLDLCNNFVDMVESLQNGDAGYSTNFYLALKVVLDAIIEKKLTAEEVSGITLVVLSDMQINEAEHNYEDKTANIGTMYEIIESEYAATGIRICGEPYKPPHILFWNFRSTSGFPCLSSKNNVSMLSGFSPALLNTFCEEGIHGLKNLNPWISLMDSMNNPRYQCMEDKIKKELAFL